MATIEELIEPYQPNYNSGVVHIPDLSKKERSFINKTSVLFKAIRKAGLPCHFEDDVFVLERQVNPYSTTKTVRYLWVDEDGYNYGDDQQVFEYGGNSKAIVKAASTWFNSKLIRK